jgi:hypothetical protein
MVYALNALVPTTDRVGLLACRKEPSMVSTPQFLEGHQLALGFDDLMVPVGYDFAIVFIFVAFDPLNQTGWRNRDIFIAEFDVPANGIQIRVGQCFTDGFFVNGLGAPENIGHDFPPQVEAAHGLSPLFA